MAPPRHFTKSTKMKLYFLFLLKFYSTILSKLLEFWNRDLDQLIFLFREFRKERKKLQKEIVFSRGKPGPLLQFLYLYPIIQGDHLNMALFFWYLEKVTCTVWCNEMGTVCAEMSSRTALKIRCRMKKTF